jgi:hypothetical protein
MSCVSEVSERSICFGSTQYACVAAARGFQKSCAPDRTIYCHVPCCTTTSGFPGKHEQLPSGGMAKKYLDIFLQVLHVAKYLLRIP